MRFAALIALADVLCRRSTRAGLGGLLLFALLALLVHLRVLAAIDLAVTEAKQPLVNPLFDAVGEVLALVVSAELSVVYAGIATLVLWRAGAGLFSVAPFGFLVGEPVEIGLKLVVDQPPVPHQFYRGVYYPLTNVVLRGSFPSGHAMRSAFFCVFFLVVLSARTGAWVRPASLIAVLLAVLAGFSRIYLGYHWLSDVVGGLLLGASLATGVLGGRGRIAATYHVRKERVRTDRAFDRLWPRRWLRRRAERGHPGDQSGGDDCRSVPPG